MPDEIPTMDRRDVLRRGGAAGATALLTSLGVSGNSAGQTETPDGDLLTRDRVGNPDASNTLTYWVLPDQSHTNQENPEHAQVYADIFTTWAQAHSDFKMSLQYQTNLEQMKTKLLQAAAQGNAPDLAQTDSFWVPNFTEDLQPVTDAIPAKDDWYPFVEDIVVENGEWLSVWKNTDCRALYYRQDLIDQYNDGEPPTTWDELVSVGQDIAENENMAGYMYNGGKWEATTFDNLAMYWAQGGDLVNDEGAPVLDQDQNYQTLLSVFEFFQRTIDSGITPQRVANIDDYGLLREAALNDETAMFLGGNWQISTIKQQVDSEEEWQNWQVSKIPQRESGIASTGTGGWTEGVFTTDSSLQQAATEYVSMYADAERMGRFCETGGYLPTRQSVFEENEFFSEDPYMQVYSDLLEDGRARPGVPIYLDISSEWQVAAGKVITGQASPQDAVDTMIENVNSEYQG